MIILLGNSPLSKNKNAPFVGKKSYKNLLGWVYKLDVDINQTIICNVNHVITYGLGHNAIQVPNYFIDLNKDLDVIIALGDGAEKKAKALGFRYFKLPNPSPKNNKLKDKKSLKKILKECKLWLKKNYEA